MHLVHIGAHRTGTTSLQKFLDSNRKILREQSVDLFTPPDTREMPSVALPTGRDTIISEENILGTMENNIWKTSIYPDAVQFLDRQKQIFKDATAILLSIRDTTDWWRSVVLFAVQNDLPLPSLDALDSIAKSERNWINVVKEIRASFPDTPLFVREFQWKVENPKQILKHVTQNEALGMCRLDRRRHNSAPAYNKLVVSLFSRNDFESLKRVQADPVLALFSKDQIDHMDQRYDDDLNRIQLMDDVEFLIDRSAHASAREDRKFLKPIEQQDLSITEGPTCMLHIGKTGSDLIRSAYGVDELSQGGTVLCGPDETLSTTLERFGPNRKLIFFFRDPIKRFVDGFNSRMCQGRPKYSSPWSDGEAIAFSYFATPNELAQALFGADKRMDSAARYAMDQLFHTRLDQEFFLTSPQAVEFEHSAGNIRVCCEYGRIEQHLKKISAELSVDPDDLTWEQPKPLDHELSGLALENLKHALKKEIAIYESCKRVAATLGFDGP